MSPSKELPQQRSKEKAAHSSNPVQYKSKTNFWPSMRHLRIKCGAFILGQNRGVFSLQQISSFGRVGASAPGACGFCYHNSEAQGQKHGHRKSAHYQANSKYR